MARLLVVPDLGHADLLADDRLGRHGGWVPSVLVLERPRDVRGTPWFAFVRRRRPAPGSHANAPPGRPERSARLVLARGPRLACRQALGDVDIGLLGPKSARPATLHHRFRGLPATSPRPGGGARRASDVLDLDLDVHAGRQVEPLERVDRLRACARRCRPGACAPASRSARGCPCTCGASGSPCSGASRWAAAPGPAPWPGCAAPSGRSSRSTGRGSRGRRPSAGSGSSGGVRLAMVRLSIPSSPRPIAT